MIITLVYLDVDGLYATKEFEDETIAGVAELFSASEEYEGCTLIDIID